MRQSIPAVPIPPRATAGHLPTLTVPGVGHSQWGLGIRVTRGDPWAFDTRVFETWRSEACFKDWLARQGLEKLVDVFKGMFSQF